MNVYVCVFCSEKLITKRFLEFYFFSNMQWLTTSELSSIIVKEKFHLASQYLYLPFRVWMCMNFYFYLNAFHLLGIYTSIYVLYFNEK